MTAVLILSLSLAALPSIGAAEPSQDPSSLELESLAHPAGTPEVATCGGLAPQTTFCETGRHGDEKFFDQVCLEHQPGYTGTIESRLYWSGLEPVRLLCHYEGGTLTGQESSGSPPWFSGIGFTHRCWSYDLHTEDRGGQGLWRCALVHT